MPRWRLRSKSKSGRTPAPPPSRDDSRARAAMAAQAEVEAHDVDQMIEARNERRRRAGRPEIGDELARQALGEAAARERDSESP